MLDALPVTAVGKPYKLALRSDAARTELASALAGVPGVHGVATTVDASSIVAAVTVAPSADMDAIKAIVDRYAIAWHLEVTT
jgi:fatty-acyl-CoA synthase